MKEKPQEQNIIEREQTPKEIKKVLETALKEKSPVDLMILTPDGTPEQQPDLLVEKIDRDYVMISYFDYERDELGEVIPLEISRIKKATLRESSE